jgi:hypothetical protein
MRKAKPPGSSLSVPPPPPLPNREEGGRPARIAMMMGFVSLAATGRVLFAFTFLFCANQEYVYPLIRLKRIYNF